MVARGEIWWHEHPGQGRRPYLVLTRTEAIPVLNQLLAVPATRTAREIPTEVPLGPTDGMPESCVLALDNITVVRKTLLAERITALAPDRMREVCEALAAATACGDPLP
ncbi:MAG: type II toxin-antitoxin system PemK/MazF family toxin [Acidobacteria bacterium]|nr:type II toxin-antitoxin system PemK/MazF family toxin [Acidobacteriota bacterium]